MICGNIEDTTGAEANVVEREASAESLAALLEVVALGGILGLRIASHEAVMATHLAAEVGSRDGERDGGRTDDSREAHCCKVFTSRLG